jgi:MraZ protein
MLFLGEYQHSLDTKGRVILPAKFREPFQEGGFLSKVLDGCLALFPPEEFEKVAAEMQEKARRGPTEREAARAFAAGTQEVTPDRQGRIAIPQNLREFAALERDVAVIGAFGRVEIWDAGRWSEANRRGEESLRESGSGLDDLI